jgi:hypothetical protein
MEEKPLCQHCEKNVASRPRQLCWACSNNPEVRALYPPKSQYARKGNGQEEPKRPPGPPTLFAPGTAEKLAVMAQRLEEGRPPYSPGDADHGGRGRYVEALAGEERRRALDWRDSPAPATSYMRRKQEGKCPSCGGEPEEGHVRCPACREKQRAWQKRFKRKQAEAK